MPALARTSLLLQGLGWLLFIVSAISFTIASIRARDAASFVGSITFLAACFFFLPPLFWAWRDLKPPVTAHQPPLPGTLPPSIGHPRIVIV
eukprot:m.304852 g.304852  ORF g.304852 m.304852 type:complete len:91 (+) comp17330_c0_seq1:567-839(+)